MARRACADGGRARATPGRDERLHRRLRCGRAPSAPACVGMTGAPCASLRAVLVAGDHRAVAALRRERPDLCLVDAGPPLDAFAVTAAVGDAATQARVVLFGAGPDDEALVGAVAAGACGYLSDEVEPSRLLAALCDVAAGLPAFPRRLGALLIADLRCSPPRA